MRSSFVFATAICAGALGACSGGLQNVLDNASLTNSPHVSIESWPDSLHMLGPLGAFASVKRAGVPHPDRSKSWISPGAAKDRNLLFASDPGFEVVYMYAMPKKTAGLQLVGKLTGFSLPLGLCSDRNGNVYVVNQGTEQVLEYSHAGNLLATYKDTYGYALGCEVDPKTGHLAVNNVFGFSILGMGPGQVLVFSSPSSPPTVLSNPNQFYYDYGGYGPDGILWVSGLNTSGGRYMVSSCGASRCSTVTLSGATLHTSAGVQWDSVRREWVLFDRSCGGAEAACSYPVSASGVLGRATYYYNPAGGNVCNMVQAAIAPRDEYVVGADYQACGSTASSNDRWAYTAGGDPTHYATLRNKYSVPFGVAISRKY